MNQAHSDLEGLTGRVGDGTVAKGVRLAVGSCKSVGVAEGISVSAGFCVLCAATVWATEVWIIKSCELRFA